MTRYPPCEVHDKVVGEHERTHGPMSRTAAKKLFHQLRKEYAARSPRVEYSVGWQSLADLEPRP